MAASQPKPKREALEEQDQSIKVRKQQLFDKGEPTGAATRPFAEYLRETPPAPLAPGVKAALWGVAALLIVLLIAAILGGRGPKPARTAELAAPGGPAFRR